MKKAIILTAGLLLATQVFAADSDLKQIMKQMKVEFKHAAEAQTTAEMQAPIQELTKLVAQAKQGEYPPEKQDIYLEGFNKLTVALDKIENELEHDEFDAAKSSLQQVDSLRKEYHEKRNPSIWKRLFG
ncbi:cytochrome b562 [Vibrio fluvialis]|uniref:cytochrome b562 n=1 Tax=Vibrio fluvialis TaxID=676 RepID=UPI00112031DE|nr:cytochrome b562 [Vibrio fluvialis]EKO3385520.1 cytochrome b562 family protein [Vibrio fluvialis]ELV8681276.1 cytochrome b562 family protein [Vibrio fluvialis]MCE7622772.1 cytochrome b562 [Vibrio fluvialis]MCG6400428.1 cytochrome b562 [Vibrio fluvialis]TOY95023.1 cytochrome b562 family protein [Vibrio fluvialis]